MVRELVGLLVYTMFISNNRATFHLWWKENFVKHQKVSEYHENDCGNYPQIYSSWIINYWGSILTLYIRWGLLSLVCVLSIIFFFLLFFFFYWHFPWQTLTIRRDRRGNHYFCCFHFHPLTNIQLIHRDFYQLFLLNQFVITRLISDETCSP